MNFRKITLTALAGTVLLAAAPAFADNYRGDRRDARGHHFQKRVVVVQQRAPYHVQRRVVVHRPVMVRQQPVVVYRQHSAHDVLGGLILGAVIGAVIANHAGH